jgi:Tol biopolymer transport system component/DNA-binding winged helix-turn-helix (wHTH) protein
MPGRTFQFGAFEVNERSGELRKHGARIRVQEQPFQILVLLLEHPGEILGREEIRARLWPENTFVDFDNAISSAVRKLREALSDTADNPRFIETLARRGYRFIGQVALQSPAPPPKATRVKAFAITAGALLIFGAAAWWLRTRPGPIAVQLVPLPLTAAPGWEVQPSFSPDGNQIAYAWDQTGAGSDSHIYVKLIGSGSQVQVTSGANPDSFPAWSPDGRTLTFIRSLNRGSALYRIPPLGGTERKIAKGYFVGGSAWSPDGKFIAVADRESPDDLASLYLVSAENGEARRLITPPSGKIEDRDPAFSPDGRTLLFIRCHETYACGLYLLDLLPGYQPNGTPRLLKDESVALSRAAWTSDGKGVLYSSAKGAAGTFPLRRIRLGIAAAPELLTYAGDSVFNPAIAGLGNRLAYAQNLSKVDILSIQAGKSPHSFAPSTRYDGLPQYSPDGRRVAFCSDRSGRTEIWVSAADGGNPVQLTNFRDPSCTPRWSPDGTSLAFDRHLNGVWRVFVMASDGGATRQLTSDNGDEAIPSWSRDGKWIYYASNRTGRYEIWKAPAQGGNGIQVTRNGGWTAFESRDGQSLYYTKNIDNLDYRSSLWALSVHRGEERLVLASVCCRAFSVVEDGIYYLPVPTPSQTGSLRFYDFATGNDQEIAAIQEKLDGGLTVSPDRKTFLFGGRTRIGSNVMVVDNFR